MNEEGIFMLARCNLGTVHKFVVCSSSEIQLSESHGLSSSSRSSLKLSNKSPTICPCLSRECRLQIVVFVELPGGLCLGLPYYCTDALSADFNTSFVIYPYI